MDNIKIFLGSSSEARNYAQLFSEVLSDIGIEPLPWWRQDAFPVSIGFFEALLNISISTQAALLLATPDDQTVIRGRNKLTPRGNVMLEYGLFTGAQGRDRVALAVIGNSELPSDLEGVSQLRFPSLMPDQTQEDYKELTLLPKLRQWTDRLRGQSQKNSSIQEVARLARDLGAERAARLLGEALWLRSKDSPLPRYPPDDVARILRRCALRTEEPVGLEKRFYLDHYIQISQLGPQDDDLTKLACVLCHNIRDECSKTGPVEFGRRVAQLLDYPVVYVAPQGPNNSLRVEGFVNPGDEVILVHDIILSGETLVKCAVEVRKKAANLVHVFTLVHYNHPECDPRALLSWNGLDLHTSQTVNQDWFSFLIK
jgi:hypothetical protein